MTSYATPGLVAAVGGVLGVAGAYLGANRAASGARAFMADGRAEFEAATAGAIALARQQIQETAAGVIAGARQTATDLLREEAPRLERRANRLIRHVKVETTKVGMGLIHKASKDFKTAADKILKTAQREVPKLAKQAGANIVSGATDVVKNQAYEQLCKLLSQTEASVRTSHHDEALPAQFRRFFSLNNELKRLLEAPESDQKAIDRTFQSLFNLVSETPLYVEGVAINASGGRNHLRTADLEERIAEPATPAPGNLNGELGLELKKCATSIRRKMEINWILGDQAPAALQESVGVESETQFHQAFAAAAKQIASRSSWPAFLRFIPEYKMLCAKFLLSLFTVPIINKVNTFLEQKLLAFTEQDRTKIMDLIANILCEGLYQYTSEIINIADELSVSKQAQSGTPDQVFQQKLASKASLHKAGFNQKEFYNYILDKMLRHCFDWSISRFIIKILVHKSGFLENPFMSLPQSIRNANGYAHNLDRAVIRFATPILRQMTNPASRPAVEGAEAVGADHDQGIRAYSNLNKNQLKKTIQSIFLASELTLAPNLAAIKKIYNGHVKAQPGLLESLGADANSIVQQTAEVAAESMLASISEIMDERFVKTTTLDALRSFNACLTQNAAPIPPQVYETTQRKRIEVLNQITQCIIFNAVNNAPILNSSASVKKINTEVKKAKIMARLIIDGLNACKQLPAANRAGYIHQNLPALNTSIKNIRAHIDQISGLSEDQKQSILDAYDHINHHVHQFLDAFNRDGEEAAKQAAAQAAIDAFNHDIETLSVFKTKANISIMDNPGLKKIATFAVSAMLKPKFNQVYESLCDFKTVRYAMIHPFMIRHIN